MIVILAVLLGLFLLACGHWLWLLGGGLIILALAVVLTAPKHWDEL